MFVENIGDHMKVELHGAQCADCGADTSMLVLQGCCSAAVVRGLLQAGMIQGPACSSLQLAGLGWAGLGWAGLAGTAAEGRKEVIRGAAAVLQCCSREAHSPHCRCWVEVGGFNPGFLG